MTVRRSCSSELAGKVEAFVSLLRAWLFWRYRPFDHSIQCSSIRLPARPKVWGAPQIDQLMRSIESVAGRVPFKAVCYQKGLAAQFMLRRRGVDAILHYGVYQDAEALRAHVWVSVGGRDVMGGETKKGFIELTRFPEPPR